MNMKGNAYHLTVNHFADMTDEEFQNHKGLMPGDGGYGSRDFDDDDDDQGTGDDIDNYRNNEKREKIKRKSRYGHVPDELDWRKYGKNFNSTISYCWFSHDVTKIQTTKLLIFLIFYFNDV